MNSGQLYLVEEELEHYRDGLINRREFMKRAVLFGATSAAAAAMVSGVTPKKAAAAPAAQTSPFSVPIDDPAITSDMITFQASDGATVVAYLALPAGAGQDRSLPAIAVCHENRGLQPHNTDVTRRYAKQGYVAISPDLPSRFGTPSADLGPEALMSAVGRLDPAQNVRDFQAALALLRDHPAVNPAKTAATGFCFGGGVIWRLTTADEQLTAAAPFYGAAPPVEDAPRIKAAVLGIYASDDPNINGRRDPWLEALAAAGVRHQINEYPGTRHGFHNDTGQAYNPEAAAQAYTDVLNWFAQHLELPAPNL
jgi:carboxymethylenebutenolidase